MPRLGPPVIGPKASPGRDHAIFIRETPGYRGTEPSRRAGDERDRPRRAICDILSRAARLRLLRPRHAPHSCLIRSS
jgi:hypothetical protein